VHRVSVRIYDTDSEGRRFLLYRSGDLITDAEAERVACLVDPEPAKPGWMRLLERRDEDSPAPPAKPLGRMKVAELRAVCEAEGIDPAGANTRSEYVAVIEAGRTAAGATLRER